MEIVMHSLGVVVAVLALAEPGLRLPVGPAPVQILARLDRKDNLELVIPYHEYRKQAQNDGTIVYAPVRGEEIKTISLTDVRVYSVDGKEIDGQQVRASLNKQVRALCSSDGKAVDVLHLALVKEGTLIIVGPTPQVGVERQK